MSIEKIINKDTKFKIALEAVQAISTVSDIAAKYQITPETVLSYKENLLSRDFSYFEESNKSIKKKKVLQEATEEIEYLYKYRPLYSRDAKGEIVLNVNTMNMLKKGEIYFSNPINFVTVLSSIFVYLLHKELYNSFHYND
jgi:hypothetical protein